MNNIEMCAKLEEKVNSGDITALNTLIRLSEKGNAQASMHLTYIYNQKFHDRSMAKKFCQKALEQGHPSAPMFRAIFEEMDKCDMQKHGK